FFQAEDGIRDFHVTGVQTCALPIPIMNHWFHPTRAALRGAMQLFMADSSPEALDWERHFRDLHHNFMPPRCQWARLMPLQTAVKARDISNLPLYSGSRDGSSGHFPAAHNEAKR